MLSSYTDFLRQKIRLASFKGFDVPMEQINPALKPHTRDIVRWAVQGGNRAIFASFGLHKCHGVGTPILMADGSTRAVETIRDGEALMGDDGQPRRVLSLARGRDNLYRVTLKNGDSFVCNEGHILSLKVSNKYRNHRTSGEVVNMPLREFLALPDYARRNCFKSYKVPVEFPPQVVPMDPYLYGAWLGDGHQGSLAWTINSRDVAIVERIKEFQRAHGLQLREEDGRGCTTYHLTRAVRGRAEHIEEFYFVQGSASADGKRIDIRYLLNDRETRLQLLAGMIDTDGNLRDGCLRIGTKWAGLRDDILYLSRSLGLSVSHGTQAVNGITYFTITISGHTDMVPCLTRKKAPPRRQIKTPLVYGFDITPLGEGDYFGFEIDGNHLYLLGDFTVTHNTATQLEIMRQIGIHRPGLRLQVAPLGVRQEFKREIEQRFQGEHTMDMRFIRRDSEIDDPATLYLTNYESVREGNINVSKFRATSLDEASVLRSYGSKTYQEFLPAFAPVEFKFVATATPSPNRFKELIHYAGYLGVMDTGQALTRFFQRDSEKAGNLTLYPHKEQEFWLWVASWAVFIQRPSDLGHSDDGYILPELDVRYHEVPSDYAASGTEKNGQHLLIPDVAMGLSAAASEKRNSMSARVGVVADLVAESPADHFIIWHDLEDERHAIQQAIPDVVSVWGTQELDEREQRIVDFSDGKHPHLSTKPIIAGSGCNFQRHCHREIFAGIGFKFNDFIQAIHRVHRFGQTKPVRIDIVHTESEREVLRTLLRKWDQHIEMSNKMTEIIRKFGLNQLAMQEVLARSIGVKRIEVKSDLFTVANNDCVEEAKLQPEASVDLIITSIPFANHYEYTPSYNDFGHTQDNKHFWEQMDFLTPELLRILKPGRIYACHVKDRINFGNVTGAGIPTVSPFHAEAIEHYVTCPDCRDRLALNRIRRNEVARSAKTPAIQAAMLAEMNLDDGKCTHRFDYMGMITIVTDVVRENNQTYRLGYTEMCKDGSKMGVGSPEYVLLFHKPQTDRGRGYADQPVVKSKAESSLARWQVDAHAFWRSSGNRLLTAEEMAGFGPGKLAKMFTDYSLANVYDYEYHVRIGEELLDRQALPSTFMSLAPGSHHPDVWHDINRMRTLNGDQTNRAVEKHVCPLQFDIVDRLIKRYSNKGEVIYDPFHGLGTVGVRAIKLHRLARGSELSAAYFMDQVHYLRAAEREVSMPTLFDFEERLAA